MLAGWDFSQYAFDGFSSVDGANLTGSANANYTGNSADFTGGASVGTMYYDGTFGSSAFNLSASQVAPQGVGDTNVGNQGFFGTLGSLAALDSQGQEFTNAKAFGLSTNGAFTFAISAGGSSDFTSLNYAAYNSNDASATLTWEYSTDGTNFNSLEADAITNSATEFNVDLSAITGASTAYIRGTLSGLDTNLFYLDNVAVSGTVVPEPSTYAAIFGAVALAFAAVRRRK